MVANYLQTCDIDNKISQTSKNLADISPIWVNNILQLSNYLFQVRFLLEISKTPKRPPLGFHRVQHLAADSARPHLPGRKLAANLEAWLREIPQSNQLLGCFGCFWYGSFIPLFTMKSMKFTIWYGFWSLVYNTGIQHVWTYRLS